MTFATPNAVLFHLARPLPSGRRHALVLTINPGVTMKYAAIAIHPVLHAAAHASIAISVGHVWSTPNAEELQRIRDTHPGRACELCQQEKVMAKQDRNMEQLLAKSVELARQRKLALGGSQCE